MRKKYDFIVGFGNACSCSQILRAAGLQLLSFPFDWIVYETDHDLCRRADAVAADFVGWLEEKDLVFRGNVDWHDKDIYFNQATHCIFNHEFPKGTRLGTFPTIRAKYDRRIGRMFEIMKRAKRVLIVRIDSPGQNVATPVEDCTYLLGKLASKFPGTAFDLLLLNFERGRTPEDRRVDAPAPHVTRVVFDYKDPDPSSPSYAPDIQLVAKLLADRYEVADYRTKEERDALQRKRNLEKYRRYGANNYLGYKIAKIKSRLAARYHPTLLRARLHRRRYAQIVPLGVNCEVAFRFYHTWGFLDSSLFAWTQCFGLKTLTDALNNLTALCSGEMELDPRSRMWICKNTGIYLHGRLKAQGPVPPPSVVDADKADLIGRINHLKRKFLDYATNESETLFVHRLAAADQSDPNIGQRIVGLKTALDRIGSRNCTLLVICEKPYLGAMHPMPGVSYRAVKAFNPGDDITNADIGDSIGWRAVFSEFAPKTILKKRHAFKFE